MLGSPNRHRIGKKSSLSMRQGTILHLKIDFSLSTIQEKIKAGVGRGLHFGLNPVHDPKVIDCTVLQGLPDEIVGAGGIDPNPPFFGVAAMALPSWVFKSQALSWCQNLAAAAR